MKKTVFITGASSGIGLETALEFEKKGWNVVATMRKPNDRKTVLHDKGITLLHLDVLEPSSIQKALNDALTRFARIDALVNNAGFAVRGVFETSTHDEVKKQYDTNVLGLMDVTRAFLPVFRKQGDGTIINVASVGGRLAFPFYSIYNSSKFAVEGFSEGLHYELKPFGIRVKIIEPGVIKTDFYGRSMHDISLPGEATDYEGYLKGSMSKMAASEKTGSHPDVIAKLIVKAANDKSYRLRYSAGSNAKMLLILRKILPDNLFLGLVRSSTM